jgi:hypothetical protein
MLPDYYPDIYITRRNIEYKDIMDEEITKEIENNGYKFSRSMHSTLEQNLDPNNNNNNVFKISNAGDRIIIMTLYEFRKEDKYKFFIELVVLHDDTILEFYHENSGTFFSNIYDGNPLRKIRKKSFIDDIKKELISKEYLEN